MTERMLCVIDKVGRIQHNRMLVLKEYLPLKVHIVSADKHVSTSNYDLVYYSHFSLFKKHPTKQTKLASVTSHKCLDSIKRTVRELSVFDAVSVNNTLLYDALKSKLSNIYYTPNGVDTNAFNFIAKSRNRTLLFGWVGNKDRATKNFTTIVRPLKKSTHNCQWKIVASSKGDGQKQLLTASQMRSFYQELDFFIVTSSTEGTPNPALEAMACGVPVITTRVGNMIEIVKDGYNGFFVDDNLNSFRKIIERLQDITDHDYMAMRHAARTCIESWDWRFKREAWLNFLMQGKT